MRLACEHIFSRVTSGALDSGELVGSGLKPEFQWRLKLTTLPLHTVWTEQGENRLSWSVKGAV
ncbi:hypothetical protein MPNT_200049 [Candidatus Methylacidithermus pantelleriae]|uniref:Uncharacterized protein n=1 Tax=Candidatus Methylacidithermus pantelleriae TaxID=2744239 RepID=A0A8J2BNQ9_9BACT|nr:hypothetical protein MPNT_200049 [Candidatus Methylacidithermus pantelleriae]